MPKHWTRNSIDSALYNLPALLFERCIDTVRLMFKFACQFTAAISPLRMLWEACIHRKYPQFSEHPASPSRSSLGETAPLLVPSGDPYAPICTSLTVQPEDFRPIRLISEGVSGKVYLVQDKFTEEVFAMKVIRKRSHNLARVVNEKGALCKAAGLPWFLSLEASMHDDTNFYLVTVRFGYSYLIPSQLTSCRCSLDFISHRLAERPSRPWRPHAAGPCALLHCRADLCSGGLACARHHTQGHQTSKCPSY